MLFLMNKFFVILFVVVGAFSMFTLMSVTLSSSNIDRAMPNVKV